MAPLRNPPKTKTRPSIEIVPASKRVKGVFGSADQSPRAGGTPRNLAISPWGSFRPARNPAQSATTASSKGIHLPRLVVRILRSLRFEGECKRHQTGPFPLASGQNDVLPPLAGAIGHRIGIPDQAEIMAP